MSGWQTVTPPTAGSTPSSSAFADPVANDLAIIAGPASAYLYQLSAFTTVATSSTVWAPLAWDTVGEDTQSGWAGAGANAARWVCPAAWPGRYAYVATVSYGTGTSGGRRYVALGKNGVTPAAGGARGPDDWADTNGLTIEVAGDVILAAGDYVQTLAMQSSGASIATRNAVSGAVCSSLKLRWVSLT